jgi:NTE family protein
LVEAGCNLVIVSHLSDGSLWDRHNFPDTTVVEIRPQKEISRDGAKDLLAFDSSRINEWIEQGYTDTIACIGKIKEALDNRSHLKSTMQEQQKAEKAMLSSSERMHLLFFSTILPTRIHLSTTGVIAKPSIMIFSSFK